MIGAKKAFNSKSWFNKFVGIKRDGSLYFDFEIDPCKTTVHSVTGRVVQAKGQPFCGLTSQSQSTMSPCFASTVSGKQTDVLLLLDVWEKLFLGLKKNSVGVAMSSHIAKLSFSACKTRHTYKTPSSVWSHPQDESLGEYRILTEIGHG